MSMALMRSKWRALSPFAPGDGGDCPASDIEFEHQVAIIAPQ
jgi:hypothetical protein